MKRSRVFSPHHPARKVACTVSAAALMLGVSQAATVGLHFQLNYCGNGQYSGFPVSLTAFGVPPGNWQNLSMMECGYCPGDLPYYTLNEVIDTTTSTGGLNPLPNGSLNVTWSSGQANFSGFGGYAAKKYFPNYGYDGPPIGPPSSPIPGGEWQIYSTFLRDGVNFGTGSSSGDNTQLGYTVDITGLKSLFTNTPFVIELIAASDSMQTLTNAFIIDATLNSTQSVTYPSTAFPPNDEGGTGGRWFRGHGGGLSTVSGALTNDHVKIIGNRAQHGTGGTLGFDNASTISGFIVTDKPVVTMSPQPVLVCRGDTVFWSTYAIGVPPLSYQWRKNGVAIPGATTAAYGITNVSVPNIGTYDLLVTNLYGTALSSAVTIGDELLLSRISNLVLDSNPVGTEHDGLNNGAAWLASSTDSGSVTRTGVMSFSTNLPSQITVAGETNFDSSTGTIMFWMRTSGLADPGGNLAALFDRLTGKGGVIAQNLDGTLLFETKAGGIAVGIVATTNAVTDNQWHQVAVVYDQSVSGPLNGLMAFYIDGQFNNSSGTGVDWSWQAGQEIELGLSHDTNSWQAYSGLLDDVRFYNRALTDSEIASAHTGALVDTNSLVMQLNFTTAPTRGITLQWQAPDGVLQSADSINGPYTDVSGAASPYNVSVAKTAKYYRYRHTPVVIISNPYLM